MRFFSEEFTRDFAFDVLQHLTNAVDITNWQVTNLSAQAAILRLEDGIRAYVGDMMHEFDQLPERPTEYLFPDIPAFCHAIWEHMQEAGVTGMDEPHRSLMKMIGILAWGEVDQQLGLRGIQLRRDMSREASHLVSDAHTRLYARDMFFADLQPGMPISDGFLMNSSAVQHFAASAAQGLVQEIEKGVHPYRIGHFLYSDAIHLQNHVTQMLYTLFPATEEGMIAFGDATEVIVDFCKNELYPAVTHAIRAADTDLVTLGMAYEDYMAAENLVFKP